MTICRMLSDDYMKRKIGMPDVVIWNKESSLCKFVCTLSDDEDVQESQKVSPQTTSSQVLALIYFVGVAQRASPGESKDGVP